MHKVETTINREPLAINGFVFEYGKKPYFGHQFTDIRNVHDISRTEARRYNGMENIGTYASDNYPINNRINDSLWVEAFKQSPIIRNFIETNPKALEAYEKTKERYGW